MKRSMNTMRRSALGLAVCLAVALPASAQQADPQQPPMPAPATGDAQQELRTVTGTVTRVTRAATGEPDGFVLNDGTAVHYPTYLSGQVSDLIALGEQVRVTGLLVQGTDPDAATLLEARTITHVDSNRTLNVAVPAGGSAGEADTSGAGGGAAAPGGAATGR